MGVGVKFSKLMLDTIYTAALAGLPTFSCPPDRWPGAKILCRLYTVHMVPTVKRWIECESSLAQARPDVTKTQCGSEDRH